MTRTSQYVRGVLDQNPPRVNNPEFHLRDNGMFIAKVPAGGIPPISDTTPGQADCEIFIIESTGQLVPETDRTTPVTRAVYNLGDSEVKGDTYIPAMLVGHELVAAGGGGGGGGMSCEDICECLCECEGLYVQPEGCYPPGKCAPDTRTAARITIKGFSNCTDSDPSCTGLTRDFADWFNGTYIIEAPTGSLPAAGAPIILGPWAASDCTILCQENYELRITTWFDCVGSGENQKLGYYANVQFITTGGVRASNDFDNGQIQTDPVRNEPVRLNADGSTQLPVGCCVDGAMQNITGFVDFEFENDSG